MEDREAEFLRILQSDWANQEVRNEYRCYLQEREDFRGEILRLHEEQLRLQGELAEINGAIAIMSSFIDYDWLDQVLPLVIRSPIFGRFYSGPSPGAAALVRPGSRVKPGSPVCIVEAMQVLNEILSELDGVIARVLVSDGDTVEYNEPLFLVRRP